MFDFIKIQFELGKVTKEWVQAQSPKWITLEQANQIIGGLENAI